MKSVYGFIFATLLFVQPHLSFAASNSCAQELGESHLDERAAALIFAKLSTKGITEMRLVGALDSLPNSRAAEGEVALWIGNGVISGVQGRNRLGLKNRITIQTFAVFECNRENGQLGPIAIRATANSGEEISIR